MIAIRGNPKRLFSRYIDKIYFAVLYSKQRQLIINEEKDYDTL